MMFNGKGPKEETMNESVLSALTKFMRTGVNLVRVEVYLIRAFVILTA